jgi:hypothetical protein
LNSCTNNEKKSIATTVSVSLKDNTDKGYYDASLMKMPKILAKLGVKLNTKKGYIAIINSSVCIECGKSRVKDCFEWLHSVKNIDYILVTEENQYITDQLANFGSDIKIITDKDKILYKYGFNYPRQVVIEHDGNSISVAKVF